MIDHELPTLHIKTTPIHHQLIEKEQQNPKTKDKNKNNKKLGCVPRPLTESAYPAYLTNNHPLLTCTSNCLNHKPTDTTKLRRI